MTFYQEKVHTSAHDRRSYMSDNELINEYKEHLRYGKQEKIPL